MAQLEQLARFSPVVLGVLDALPDCVKSTTINKVLASGCNADAVCICKDDRFLQSLLEFILRNCEPPDQDISLHIAQDFCSEVIPSLNDNRQAEIIAVLVINALASTVAVILRMMARNMSSTKYGLDDVFIMIALLFAHALNAIEMAAIYFGFGRHELMLSFYHIRVFLQIEWLTSILISTSVTAARLSLLFFYHRVFPTQRFRIVAIIIGCISLAWWIGSVVALVLFCIPVHSFWDRSVPGTCTNETILGYGITGTEIATNILVLVLPIPWLWGLKLPRPKKIALGGIFLLGSFVCIACVVRFPLIKPIHQSDASWSVVPFGLWALVECNIGIASVCLPIMRPLFIKRSPFPVRSHFSAFSFTISRGASRLPDDESRTGHNLSGKTITSHSIELAPRIPSLKFPNDHNISFELPIQGPRIGDDEIERSSTPGGEPWGQNIGAQYPAHQPWGQNIGANHGNQEWESDVVPPGTSPERGPRTDGWKEQWADG